MMNKTILAIMVLVSIGAYAGQISLPEERLAVPDVQGSHLICIWDEAAEDWQTAFTSYDHSGLLSFQLPEVGKWYWIGLWDEQLGDYVFGKWVGHFISE
jgi:hypothetical protein